MKKFKLFILFSFTLLLLSCSGGSDDLNSPTRNNQNNNSGNTNNNNGNNNNGNSSGNTQNNPLGTNGEITLYSVQGNDIENLIDYNVTGQNLIYQQDIQEHLNLWRLVKKVIPLNYRSKIGEFLIYDGSVDGTNSLSMKIKSDLSKWRLGIAINYANNDQQELIFNIVHEFGFILTQNDIQIDSSIRENTCTNYYNEFGCAYNDSYINQFKNQFWSDIWPEYLVSKNGSELDMQTFYTTYNDRFFSANSAISPEEDIADVFATFVTREEGSTGSSIKEQKIEFMYNFSELVTLRNYIRTNLGG